MQELTDRQRKFINAYYKWRSLTKAAIEAGYSPATANRYGYTLINKPHIKALIVAMLAKVGQELA